MKRNEDRAKADAMAKDLEIKNDKSLWEKIENTCHCQMFLMDVTERNTLLSSGETITKRS